MKLNNIHANNGKVLQTKTLEIGLKMLLLFGSLVHTAAIVRKFIQFDDNNSHCLRIENKVCFELLLLLVL